MVTAYNHAANVDSDFRFAVGNGGNRVAGPVRDEEGPAAETSVRSKSSGGAEASGSSRGLNKQDFHGS